MNYCEQPSPKTLSINFSLSLLSLIHAAGNVTLEGLSNSSLFGENSTNYSNDRIALYIILSTLLFPFFYFWTHVILQGPQTNTNPDFTEPRNYQRLSFFLNGNSKKDLINTALPLLFVSLLQSASTAVSWSRGATNLSASTHSTVGDTLVGVAIGACAMCIYVGTSLQLIKRSSSDPVTPLAPTTPLLPTTRSITRHAASI